MRYYPPRRARNPAKKFKLVLRLERIESIMPKDLTPNCLPGVLFVIKRGSDEYDFSIFDSWVEVSFDGVAKFVWGVI